MFLAHVARVLIEHADALHLRRAEDSTQRQQVFIAQQPPAHHHRQMFTQGLAQSLGGQRSGCTQVDADDFGATGVAGRNDLRDLHERAG